jgi:phosphatidylglycerol:prolipoprotein diacylglycerol transferase
LHPVLFEIFGFEVGSYALATLCALIAGLFVFARLGVRDGHDRWAHVEMGLWAFIVAILSSKLFGAVVGFDPAHPMESLQKVLRFAGHFYVGFLAGATFLVLAFRRRGIALMEGLDELAPGLALAHALGRIGCLLAGCCWGAACEAPWAVTFTSEKAHEVTGVPLHQALHPTQLYEFGAELVIFGILMVLHARVRIFRGHTFLSYVVLYGLVRFSLEFLRDDPRGTFGATSLPTSQGLAIVSVIVAGIVYAVLWKRRREAK